MTDDAATAYICIYCPFNSNNLEALETHLTRIHGHGCQDESVSSPPPSSLGQSSKLSNIITKTGKREAPDDEQSLSLINGIKQTTDISPAIKRIKRTSSPTNVFINRNNDNSEADDDDDDDGGGGGGGDDVDDDNEFDDDDDDDDERYPTAISPKNFLTCPICSSTYHRLGHLLRHAKRKHQMDLSNYDGPHTFNMLTTQIKSMETNQIENKKDFIESMNVMKTEDNNGSKKSIQPSNETNLSGTISETTATTDCPYCDYKTIDIEQFKLHIVAHIRDKNYRCLLCNRLYKYRGDCSFHIRRKHHRYSANSNEYIQRFLFDTTDGDETMSTQPGGHGSLINGSNNSSNMSREPDEPVRYFGCPYCDYTSNYGGDVRKHQARKHPNAESKVIKIIRQDSEHQVLPSTTLSHNHHIPPEDDDDDDDDDERDSHSTSKSMANLTESHERKDKIKTVKKNEGNFLSPHPSPLTILPNFAPVRVFQCSSCHQQGTYKWVVERHIRAKHPEQPDVHVIELPAELAVKIQKITPPLKRYRCSLCPLQSKHTWVIIRHIKHFHTLQTASVLDIQPDGTSVNADSFSLTNGDLPSNKLDNHDSESTSTSSSCVETGTEGVHDFSRHQDIEDDEDESDHNRPQINGAMTFIYKCSLCDFASNIPQDTLNHISNFHPGQSKAHMLTQCRPIANDNLQKLTNKKSKHKNGNANAIATVIKTLTSAPLSPTTALAKAKFSPAVEEALLSLQSSKINMGLFAVQPKFGIKRLKCRHCFYRSNWKTDMIRHVRIRHSLTDPDHNRDMIIMSEQEARSTIETYENTFGKELRRRTFRTWNDWAKAEEEFTPKDGSLQYVNPNAETTSNNNNNNNNNIQKPRKTIITTTNNSIKSSINDETKRTEKMKFKQESKTIVQNYNPSLSAKTEEFKQLPNTSNIVSRLFWNPSPLHTNNDDAPLDLSLKATSNIKTNPSLLITSKIAEQNEIINHQLENESSTVNYICSVCPYKRSNLSAVQQHLSLHLNGSGIVCPLCSYTTSSNKSMISHMTTIHPTSQSNTKFLSATRIPNAMIIEQHQCNQCSYQCDRAEALNLHRRLEHEDDEEYDIDSSSSVIDEDERDSTIDRTNDYFQCPLCSPSSNMNYSSNLEQFTIHIYMNHPNHLQNNQSCPFCSYLAHTASTHTLLEHIKLHFNGTLVQPDPIIGAESVKELLME